ncbi:MAG TPA: hypothetical protein VIK62_02655, partial [Verrucomicrobiae bacterium]
GLFCVAMGAVGRTERIMHQVFDIGMAIHTGKIGVNGMSEGIGRKNQRFGFAVDRSRRVWIKMAVQTIAVGEFWRRVRLGRFLRPGDSRQLKTN